MNPETNQWHATLDSGQKSLIYTYIYIYIYIYGEREREDDGRETENERELSLSLSLSLYISLFPSTSIFQPVFLKIDR